MIKSITQHSYFEKKPKKQMGRCQDNPSIGWVHLILTHVCPLAWGNKNVEKTHTIKKDNELKKMFMNIVFCNIQS